MMEMRQKIILPRKENNWIIADSNWKGIDAESKSVKKVFLYANNQKKYKQTDWQEQCSKLNSFAEAYLKNISNLCN